MKHFLFALAVIGVLFGWWYYTTPSFPKTCTNYLYAPVPGRPYYQEDICHYRDSVPQGAGLFVMCTCLRGD